MEDTPDLEAHDYWAPRPFLRKPILDLFAAATLLERGVEAHLAGNAECAVASFEAANTKPIRDYIESMWGARDLWPEQKHYLRWRKVENLPAETPDKRRQKPSTAIKRQVVARDGFLCRYCALPVIPGTVRKALSRQYPGAVPWGNTNSSQHAALQALWLQYEHVVPLTRGGANTVENIVVSCAACNYMKWNYTLAEIGLEDPRDRVVVTCCWDGLTRLIGGPESCPL